MGQATIEHSSRIFVFKITNYKKVNDLLDIQDNSVLVFIKVVNWLHRGPSISCNYRWIFPHHYRSPKQRRHHNNGQEGDAADDENICSHKYIVLIVDQIIHVQWHYYLDKSQKLVCRQPLLMYY